LGEVAAVWACFFLRGEVTTASCFAVEGLLDEFSMSSLVLCMRNRNFLAVSSMLALPPFLESLSALVKDWN